MSDRAAARRWTSRVGAVMLYALMIAGGSGCGDCDHPASMPTPTAALPVATATGTGASGAPTPTLGTPEPTSTFQEDRRETPVTPSTPPTATVTGTRLVTATPTATGVPHAGLRIGHVAGTPGGTVVVAVTLTEIDPEVSIVATQNDVGFDALAPIAENEAGEPACAVNPAIAKNGTVFAFQPPFCAPGSECRGIRALVLPGFLDPDENTPIAAGAELYACTIEIAADAEPGVVLPLRCSMALASSPEGNPIEVRCEDGEITVQAGAE